MQGGWLEGLAALAPSRCAVCGAWPAGPVCTACTQRFARAVARCGRCALPVPAGVAECGTCLRDPPPLARCHAAVAYAYPWSQLVTRFKFQGQPGWAASLAGLLLRTPGVAETLRAADFVVPLPLSPQRLAARGFNQAMELARRLAPTKVEPRLLLRLRDTPAQSALPRARRLANVRGAFGPDPLRAGALRGRRVALVDDVMTSGASLFAAARALKEAGASSVDAIVFARTDEPG
jgi:ComF family protein